MVAMELARSAKAYYEFSFYYGSYFYFTQI